MRSYLSFLALILILASCNTYTFTNSYSEQVLKSNGLKFRTIDLPKYELTYWDSETSKPVLILIHGFGTSGNFQWFKQSRALSKDYRLIIVNLLYFGSKPAEPTYTVDGQADALNDLMEKLNIRSCCVCGTSYGGLVAAELARMEPEKIKKLVLMDTPLKFLTENDIRTVCSKYGVKDQMELFVPSDPEKFKKLMEITYFRKPIMPMSMTRSFYNHSYEKEKSDLQNIYKSVLAENKTFIATEYHFRIPVLLIWGEKDDLVPVHVGQDLKAHIGENARLEIVPETAHIPNLENKKVVNSLLLAFLKE